MAARRTSEPLRTCVGCRRVRPKRELVRIARAQAGTVTIDQTGYSEGRGAYVCPEKACVRRAQRRLAGALRTSNVDFTQLTRELSV